LQLHLEGSNTIGASQEKVFAMLTNPQFLARTLPDAEDVRVLDSDNLEARLKLRIAVVSSTLKIRMRITDREPPSKATMVAEGTGSGSTMKITSVFTLEGGSTTKMTWSADAEIAGVMAGLGSTLLRGFATRKVAEIFDGITKAVEAASD
jgi:carbon monoxide dehydrogenase subunit G